MRWSLQMQSHLGRKSSWFWDALCVGYLLSGGYRYDARIDLGQHISINQILAAAVLLHTIWSAWRARWQHVRARATLAAAIALTAMLLVRVPASASFDYGRFKTISYLLFVLPVLLHLEIHVRGPGDVRRILQLTCMASGVLLLCSLPHVARLGPGQRLAIWGGGPNVFARLMATGGLVALAYWRPGSCSLHRPWTWWRPALILGAGLALLLAGSKAVLLSSLPAAIFALVALRWHRSAGLVFAGLLLLLMAPLFAQRLVRDKPKDGGVVRLLRAPDVDDAFGSYGARLRYMKGSWAQITSHPWLGVGTGSWGACLGMGAGRNYPHNIVLEILSELGLSGLLLVMLPLLCYPRAWIEDLVHRRDPTLVALVALAIFWAINVQFSGDVVDNRYLWWFLLLLELHGLDVRSAGPREWTPVHGGSSV